MRTNGSQQLRLDGYIRVSKVKGREGASYISPDQQRDQIERWAQLRGVEILNWETDEDQTGGKLARPGLDRILERIQSRPPQTGGIAVARLDRFSRAGVADALKVCGEIIEAGGQISAIDLGIDPTTPTGEFTMTLFLALARMEWRRIKDNWHDSRGRAATRGVHMGPTPYGYVRNGDRGRDGRLLPGQNPPLQVDPTSGPVITEVFERRANGETWISIWRDLHARGVVSTDGKSLSRNQLKRWVENDVYLGVVVDGVSGVKSEDCHPPLVDYATFQQAQSGRGVRHINKNPEALLTGLCRCSSCRYSMTTRRAAQSQNARLSYDCNRRINNGDCPDAARILVEETGRRHYLDRVAAKKATRMVDEGMSRRDVAREFGITVRGLDSWRERVRSGEVGADTVHRGLDDYVVEKVFERLPEILMRQLEDNQDLERLEREMKSAITRHYDHGLDEELEEALGRDVWVARGRKLREEAEAAEAAYNGELQASGSRVSTAARRMRDDWPTLTVAEKREILGDIIRHVFVKPPVRKHSQEPISPERIHIVWFDDSPVDVPRQGRRDYVIRPFEFPGDLPNPSAAVAAL